jgi:hypothetical protein
MRKLAIALLLVVPFAGCAKKSDKKKDETAKVSADDSAKQAKDAKEKAAKEKEAELNVLVQQLKTKEDFEDSAETEVTEENLEAELTKLEGQLEAEAPEPAGAASAGSATALTAAGAKPAPKVPAAPGAVKPAAPKPAAPPATP